MHLYIFYLINIFYSIYLILVVKMFWKYNTTSSAQIDSLLSKEVSNYCPQTSSNILILFML